MDNDCGISSQVTVLKTDTNLIAPVSVIKNIILYISNFPEYPDWGNWILGV